MVCSLDGDGVLTSAGDDLQRRAAGPHRGRWPSHPLADLRGVQPKLVQRAAERVAMHAELIGGLALVAAMTRQHLEDVALLELTHGVVIAHAGGMHLEDDIIEIAFQSRRLPSLRFA
jgi:hypothetical protein